MDQPAQDADVASGLLAYLARRLDAPGLAYAEAPARIRGGFDAAIYGFRLAAPPAALDGPLILRLNHPTTDPRRVRIETAVHNGLAALGYPAPRVFVAETDAAALGSSFIVMARLAGHPLAHGVEGMGGGVGIIGLARLIVGLPALLRRITDDWVEMQLRLHALPVEPVEAALKADGIDPAVLGFDAQFERLRHQVEHAALSGLLPGMAWLEAHRPPEPARRVICHGDFHPLNILAENGKVTGVIDWPSVALAAPELDMGSSLANIGNAPFALPALLEPPVRLMLASALRRYYRGYRRQRPLDDRAVRYYQVFRCMTQLAWSVPTVASGMAGGGAFTSEAGIRNLIANIKTLSGVTLRLHGAGQ